MLSVLPVGEIRVADDSDFRKLKFLGDETDNWKLEYQKNNTSVWTKNNDVSSFKVIKVHYIILRTMIPPNLDVQYKTNIKWTPVEISLQGLFWAFLAFQVKTTFEDISAETLYDVLHDPEYRKTWDHSMLEGYEICAINPNNDIGYYALKSPPPLRNRDFVTQRSWLDMGKEKWILNHSVNHESCPPRKGYIRGVSYLTGYLVRQQGENKCQFTYVSQSDPRGKLPVWVVNKATKILAPKIISRIQKACKGYPSWKSQNNPHLKPWIFPEQLTLPRLDMAQIKPLAAGVSSESLDESGINEDEVDAEQYVND